MDMETLLQYDWGRMAPEFTILLTATLLSLIDLCLPKRTERKGLFILGLAGIVIALLFLINQIHLEPTLILMDTYRFDGLAVSFKFILLVGALLTMMLAMGNKMVNQGEYVYLMLTALLGAMMMASSADLITLIVGLELLSISSYILVGLQRRSQKANEGAMKYVVQGGIASSILLFGFSYLYGLTGSTQLSVISELLPSVIRSDVQGLLVVALVFIFTGIAFKLAVVPFSMWAPDVYEGAPVPIAAFLSGVSKAAGFVLLLRLSSSIFTITELEPMVSALLPWLAVGAAVTMMVGNVVALRQTNMKRLLAYSSIAHAGYLLVPVVSFSPLTVENMWFYLLVYLFMTIGAFAIVYILSEQHETEGRDIFKGLYSRSPFLAIAMTIILLSLAGIPGTAGFFAKLHLILGALSGTSVELALVIVMVLTTILSYIYYFGIIAHMFLRKNPFSFNEIRIPAYCIPLITSCVMVIVVLGVLPNIALDFYHNHVDFVNLTKGLWNGVIK